MGKILDVGESLKSNYLDVLKHIQGEGVCESLAVLESVKVLGIEAHWINGEDYGTNEHGVSGNYECIHGVCCRVLGEVPSQYYLLPVWQYTNLNVSLEGSFKIWKLPRKKYLTFIDMISDEGFDVIDYDIYLRDATKKAAFPDYTIEIGRHKSGLPKEWRAGYIVENFGANLMDMMDVSVERRMDEAKWDELLFTKLGFDRNAQQGEELRYDGDTQARALPKTNSQSASLPPVNNQGNAVPPAVDNVGQGLPPISNTIVDTVQEAKDIHISSRVDEAVVASATELNNLLGSDSGSQGLPPRK